jgi:hypothetical protein
MRAQFWKGACCERRMPLRTRSALTIVAAVAAFGSSGIGQSEVPAVLRSTYGGRGIDMVNAVTTDAIGNIYIAGRTTSPDLPGTDNAVQKTLRGRSSYGAMTDGFVAKLAPDGRVIWSSYLGGNDARVTGSAKFMGTSADEARAIAVDAAGNVYVAGTTSSTDFPTTTGAFQPDHQSTAGNTYDGFLVKFNPTGSELAYSTYIGGVGGSTTAEAIAVDRNGDTWVLVSTTSGRFPWTHDVSGGAGGAGVHLGRFPANGTPGTWTRIGFSGELAAGLSLDRFARPHVLTHGSFAGASIVLTQLDETGTRLNFRSVLPIAVTGTSARATADLAIGPDGTIVIVGLVAGSLPVTQPFQPQPGGSGDAFVAALNPQGVPEVLSYLGGSGPEPNRPRVAVDVDRHIHIALDTGSFDLRTERGVIPRHPDSPLYTSADRGRSWTWAGRGLTTLWRGSDFAFDASRGAIYVLVRGMVLRSTDRGTTWQEVRRIEPFGARGRLAIDPRDPTTLYAGDTNLYRVDRAGETVTQLRQATAGVGGFRVDSVAVRPHDGSVWVGNGTGVEVSFDRGATWEPRDLMSSLFGRLSPTSWAMDSRRAGRMIIGTNFGVFGTEDQGRSWQELTSTLTVAGYPLRPTVEAVAIDPTDSRRIYAGTVNRGIIVTDDGGATWRQATPNLGVTAIAVDSRAPDDVFAAVTDYTAGKFGVLVSRDRGKTWTWSLLTRDAPTALAADRETVYVSGPTDIAPYTVRLNGRQGSYVPSFASYLMEGTVRALTTTAEGDTLLVFNSSRSQPDVAILRIAR